VPRSIFGFARDETDGSRVMTQVKNPHGRDDLPSLGYKIETTQLHVVRGGGVSARAGQHGGARDRRLSVPIEVTPVTQRSRAATQVASTSFARVVRGGQSTGRGCANPVQGEERSHDEQRPARHH
jgi:hypothetical protein